MGDAQRGDDAIAFYAAALGRTGKLLATDVAVQISDADGALPPGRYLLHLGDVANNVVLWVAVGPFAKGGTVSVSPDVPFFPMGPLGVIAFELNVVKGENDRIAVVATGGGTPSGTLYYTLISRGA